MCGPSPDAVRIYTSALSWPSNVACGYNICVHAAKSFIFLFSLEHAYYLWGGMGGGETRKETTKGPTADSLARSPAAGVTVRRTIDVSG